MAAWASLLGLLVILLGYVCAGLLPAGPNIHSTSKGVWDYLLDWDANYYRSIAVDGYQWVAVRPPARLPPYNVAFFPLYPIVENFLMHLSGSRAAWVYVAPGLLFGILANFAFQRLAAKVLPSGAASWAVLFFALWPASCFLVMGYPAGLINLCAALSVLSYVNARPCAAALWCGLGCAAGPVMVFMAAGLCVDYALHQWRNGLDLKAAGRIIMFGLASVCGLIAFMVYLQLNFGDALAFLHAQDSWSPPLTLGQHLFNAFNLSWYLAVFVFVKKSFGFLFLAHHSHFFTGLDRVNISFQYFFNFIVFFTFCGIVLRSWRLPAPLAWQGIFILLGYWWFNVTSFTYFFNGIRLLFPVFAVFLLLASLVQKKPWVGYCAAIFLALMGCLESALMFAGYTVI